MGKLRVRRSMRTPPIALAAATLLSAMLAARGFIDLFGLPMKVAMQAKRW